MCASFWHKKHAHPKVYHIDPSALVSSSDAYPIVRRYFVASCKANQSPAEDPTDISILQLPAACFRQRLLARLCARVQLRRFWPGELQHVLNGLCEMRHLRSMLELIVSSNQNVTHASRMFEGKPRNSMTLRSPLRSPSILSCEASGRVP